MSDECVQLCFSSYHFYPVHGGGQLRFLGYFPGLRQRGIHTSVFTGTPQSSKLAHNDYTREWNRYRTGSEIPADPIEGTPIHRVRLPDNNGLRRRIIYNRELVRFCRRPGYYPDIVQLFQTLPHRSTRWLRQLKKSGISLTYAYTAPAKLPRSFFKRALRLWRIQIVSRLINCIIVSSSEMGKHVQEMGFHGRIEVIPNGIDLKRFHPERSDPQCQHLRASMGMNDNSIMIMTVGSLIPEKGADLLLEAWTPLAKRFSQYPFGHCWEPVRSRTSPERKIPKEDRFSHSCFRRKRSNPLYRSCFQHSHLLPGLRYIHFPYSQRGDAKRCA